MARHRDLDIRVAMSLADHLSLADVKNRSSEIVGRLAREHGRVVITKRAPVLMADIREADAERAAGATTALTKGEAPAQLRPR